ATDLDTRFLEVLDLANFDVRRHNLVADALPVGEFDLVHTRMVLMHIPEREQILPRLAAALKPGGWLLLEEQDAFSVSAASAGPYAEVWAAFEQLAARAGVAPTWARGLPGLLPAHGLDAIEAEADVPMMRGDRRWPSSGG